MCEEGRPSASGNFAGQGPKKDGAPVPGNIQDFDSQEKYDKAILYQRFS
jgi:hypothetical protein